METKYKVGIVVGIALVSFASGRWMAPVRVETKTVEVEKKVFVKDDAKNTKQHRDKKTVIDVKKDGSKTITVVDITDTSKKETSQDKSVETDKKESSKLVEGSVSKVTISLLVGSSITNPAPIYGLAITKPILGPFTLGVFAFTNTTIGGSVGLTF